MEQVPWTAREMYAAGAYLFDIPTGPSDMWTPEDWFRRVERWICYAVTQVGPFQAGQSVVDMLDTLRVPVDGFRSLSRREAEVHRLFIQGQSGFPCEIITVRVTPSPPPESA
jgi:hypothetical protein